MRSRPGPDRSRSPSPGARTVCGPVVVVMWTSRVWATCNVFALCKHYARYLRMSNSFGTEPPAALQLDGPPEPDPFTSEEFGAWRGLLRVHATILRELDRRLLADHG